MTLPSISVVVTTHNRRDLLWRSLRSCAGQSLGPLETLVVVDGSTDLSEPWLRLNHPEARLVINNHGWGKPAALNAGIRAARGQVVAVLDDDDEWAPDYLRQVAAAWAATPEAAFVYTDYVLVLQDGSGARSVRSIRSAPSGDPIAHMLLGNYVHSMSLFSVARKTWLDLGGLNSRYSVAHDRDFYLRLLHFGAPTHVPQPLARIHRTEGSLTSRHDSWRNDVGEIVHAFLAQPRNQLYRALGSRAVANVEGLIARRRAGPAAVDVVERHGSMLAALLRVCMAADRYILISFPSAVDPAPGVADLGLHYSLQAELGRKPAYVGSVSTLDWSVIEKQPAELPILICGEVPLGSGKGLIAVALERLIERFGRRTLVIGPTPIRIESPEEARRLAQILAPATMLHVLAQDPVSVQTGRLLFRRATVSLAPSGLFGLRRLFRAASKLTRYAADPPITIHLHRPISEAELQLVKTGRAVLAPWRIEDDSFEMPMHAGPGGVGAAIAALVGRLAETPRIATSSPVMHLLALIAGCSSVLLRDGTHITEAFESAWTAGFPHATSVPDATYL